MYKNKLLLLVFILLSTFLVAQKTDSSYLIYLKQFEQLSMSRSMGNYEIHQALEEFGKSSLTNNKDFAQLLNRLYSKKRQIGVLLYFHYNDTLRRTLFEPGKVIEETLIPITAERLTELSNELNVSLNLYQLSSHRSPKLKRGTITENVKESGKNYDLDSTLKTLTSILIPASFNETYKHLIIIPALNIGTLPFHLLKPYKDSSYLIDKCSFTVAPTLVDFVGLRGRIIKILNGQISDMNDFDRDVDNGDMGDPKNAVFKVDKVVFVCNPDYPQKGEYAFPNLPGAVREVDSAMKYFPNYKLFKGKGAIKDSIIHHLDHADIGYFATHGITNVEDVMKKSYLVLSGADPFFTSQEIQDLRLREGFLMPELVILSACQTGLGKSMGAGVAGSLARSFILSGSNHVVMSLWNVDDDATAFLMNRFVYYLKNNKPFMPAEHLRNAILDTRKKFPHPAHWASFSFVGVDYD